MTTLKTDSGQDRKSIRAAARLTREIIDTFEKTRVISPLKINQNRSGQSVYVLRLDPSVWNCKRCAVKLGGERGAPAFYIGTTGIPVRERINQHLSGTKSSHMVREHFAQRAKRMEPRNLARETLEARLTNDDAALLELKVLPMIFRGVGLGAHSA